MLHGEVSPQAQASDDSLSPPEVASADGGALIDGDIVTDGAAVIEGGDVTLSDGDIPWKQRHDSETAKALTFTLVGILVGSLVLHYAAVVVLSLYNQAATVELLGDLFDKWLPVISSFVGGAVTYYLTRREGGPQ